MTNTQIVIGATEAMVAEYSVQNDGGPYTVIIIENGEIVSVDEWNDMEKAKAAYNWGEAGSDGETITYRTL